MEFDSTIARLATYASSTTDDDLDDPTRTALANHVLDSLGCALGAFREGPSIVARQLVASARDERGASVIGLGHRTTLEYATFANACLVRYLDYNDNYLTNGGGHTSDLIPAVLAAAESSGASGRDVLVALHVGYEVFAALADAVPIRDRGWDYPAFLGIAAAAATANVFGLDQRSTGHALAMTITPNLPLGITRAGHLSNWKGLASPYAAMAAMFATRLAAAGITGPGHAVEGVRGLWALATQPFSLERLGQPKDGRNAIARSSYKLYVAEFNAQGPVHEFVQLHHQGIRPHDIESIRIATYEVAWSEIGGGQDDHADKWDPKTKETADHSMAYMVAVALTDGRCDRRSYTPERITDPALRPLLERITVVADDEISKTWVERPSHVIDVTLRDGRSVHVRSDFPVGHPCNPMTDEQLVGKFRTQSATVLDECDTERLLDIVTGLADLGDLTPLWTAFRAVAPA